MLIFHSYFNLAGLCFVCLIWYDMVWWHCVMWIIINIYICGWGIYLGLSKNHVYTANACPNVHVQNDDQAGNCYGWCSVMFTYPLFHITSTRSKAQGTPQNNPMIAGNYWFAVSAWDQSSLTGMTLLWKLLLADLGTWVGYLVVHPS